MEMSNEVGELFTALSKFQGELENAKKDKAGHGYKYADLGACIDIAKPVLAANSLAVTQLLGMSPNGKQTMITMMTHSSGQWMRSEVEMVEAVLAGGGGKNPAQQLGSAITYHRRYTFAAIIGMAQEDDDAVMLQQGRSKPQPKAAIVLFSQDDIEKVSEYIAKKGYTVEQICQSFNVRSLAELPQANKKSICEQIGRWAKDRDAQQVQQQSQQQEG